MTQSNNHIPAHRSVLNEIVIAALTTAMIVVAGLLSLAQFAVGVA